MTLFSKFTKSNNSDKSVYPWSQRKLNGSSNALPRFGHGATLIDNQHFIVFGGVHTKGNTKKNQFLIDINNMSASSISTSGDTPSLRSFSTIVSIGGFVLLYGGEPIIPGEIWDPYFYALHINTKQWSRVRTKGNLPSERSGHSTCVSEDGIMYVWGGHFQRKYLNDLCAFNIKDYPSKAEWEFIAYENQGPPARSGHVSAIYDNKLYIFGGVNASHLYNDIWYFDLATRVWHQIPAVGYIPAPRESCAATLVDDTVYIFGGKGLNGVGLGDLCAFRIKSQRWYMFQNMGPPPSPRYGSTLTVIQNKIYVFGGESMSGKIDDSSYVYILDCSKIKYPPETDHSESERSNLERANHGKISMNNNNIHNRTIKQPDLQQPDYYDGNDTMPKMNQQSPQINTRQLQNSLSPMLNQRPMMDEEKPKLDLPVPPAIHPTMETSSTLPLSTSVPPPRPPRDGATLIEKYRQSSLPMDSSLKFRRESIQNSSRSRPPILPNAIPPLLIPPPSNPPPTTPSPNNLPMASPQTTLPPIRLSQQSTEEIVEPEEIANLMREIVARDVIINEMKKKEQWWRNEVSIARHLNPDFGINDDHDAKEALLINFDQGDEMNNDKLILFKQLVTVKAEIKKIKSNIAKQTEPLSQKMDQTERVRTVALAEAAYYKAKYTALKTNNKEALESLESDRVQVLEQRLHKAYEEKAKTERNMQHIQAQSKHDKAARLLAEERARDAQIQSEETQAAHQEALEKISKLYEQILEAEAKGRDDALVIAELSNKLANHLSIKRNNQDLSQIHLEMGRLEVANIKSRNEIAILLRRLEESRDEEMNLKILLNEKDQAYTEAILELEQTCIELELLKGASASIPNANKNNGSGNNNMVDLTAFVQ